MQILTRFNRHTISIGLLLLRLTIGMVMAAHGAQKVLGWYGGKGLADTVAGMSESLGVPPLLGYAAAFSEFLGGLLVMVGLITRPAASFVAITMFVASSVHMKNGFFAPKGLEYPLTLALIAVVIAICGPGKYSLDWQFFKPKGDLTAF